MDTSRWATVALATPGCLLAAASVVALRPSGRQPRLRTELYRVENDQPALS